ncbi:ATP-binding protein [Thioalkalivibrio sp.]|uniref:ATP-binding protein n=1 Tax=Thioalkalivibrio sp. TaxID=2093813 RepID=UPI0035641E75
MTDKVVDVTIHLDESLGAADREKIQDELRGLRGVVAASSQDETPHLVVVGYDPDAIDGRAILDTVTDSGIQAELVGM